MLRDQALAHQVVPPRTAQVRLVADALLDDRLALAVDLHVVHHRGPRHVRPMRPVDQHGRLNLDLSREGGILEPDASSRIASDGRGR